MVATLISTFVIGGFVTIFLSLQQSAHIQRELATMQDGARLALRFIADDVRMAGYIGCPRASASLFQHHFHNAIAHPFQPSQFLLGYSDHAMNKPEHLRGMIKPGTDLLTLYYAKTNSAYLLDDMRSSN